MSLFLKKNYNLKSSLIVMVVSLLLLGGCSHRNFIKAGQKFYATEHFELAVAQFEQALTEKPDDQETINQLQQAKSALIAWANQLEVKADNAVVAGHNGKAMLLYSKVLTITHSEYASKKYRELYNELSLKSSVSAQWLPNKLGLNANVFSDIDGLNLIGQSAIKLNLKKSNPIFEIQQSSLAKTEQYISGSQMISNPEFSEIQHQIRSHQNEQHLVRDHLSDSRHQVSHQQDRVVQLQNQQQSLQQNQLRTELSASNKQSLSTQLNQISSRLDAARQAVDNSRRHRKQYQRQLSHNRHELSRLIDQLSYTPAIVSAPIYSDYTYQIQQQKNLLSAQLFLTISDRGTNNTRAANVMVSSEDQSHPGHPILNLGPNPMQVKSQPQLIPLFNQEIKLISQRMLTEFVDEHRHRYILLASRSDNSDQQLEWWVAHGLVTKQGAVDGIAAKIRQRLALEYGVGGEFDINSLLHL